MPDWDFHCNVGVYEVTGFQRNGSGFEYVIHSLGERHTCHHVDETKLYSTSKDAEAVGKAEVARIAKEKRTHAARCLDRKRKDGVAGMVSYWKNEIRKAKKRIKEAETALREIDSDTPGNPSATD